MKRNIDWRKFFDSRLYIKIKNEYEFNLFLKSIPKKYNAQFINIYYYDNIDWIYGASFGSNEKERFAVYQDDSRKEYNWRYDKYVKNIKEFMTDKEILENEKFERQLAEEKENYEKEKKEKEESKRLEELKQQELELAIENFILKALDDTNSKVYKKIVSISNRSINNINFDRIIDNRVLNSLKEDKSDMDTILSYNDKKISTIRRQGGSTVLGTWK